MKEKKPVNFKIDPELRTKLRIYTFSHGVSYNVFFSALLMEFFNKPENKLTLKEV